MSVQTGNATRYLSEPNETLRADDGFVDTGDRVELRDGRYHFVGRAGESSTSEA